MTPTITRRIKRDLLAACERIANGRLRLITPEGEVHDFGRGQPEALMELHDWSVVTTVLSRGDIGLGETYVAGLWDTPSVEDLSTVLLRNIDRFERHAAGGFWARAAFRFTDTVLRTNSRRGAARNIRAHYDVGNEFYMLWLDRSMTYSSAIFAGKDTDLERGQKRKYDRILDRLPEGERLLEIGCGWGGFAERAADAGRQVTGLTISPSQKGYADARLDGRADIRLQDYRAVQGTFDHIVSIEMIEAVGRRYWPTYFATVRDRLAKGGRAMIQAITVPDAHFDDYQRRSDYIRHYTFPGGMLLSDATIADQARRAGLKVRGSFAFGKDYAETCRIWATRLEDQASRIAALGHDAAFLRNWRYYLGGCAAAFATGRADVVQVELAHV